MSADIDIVASFSLRLSGATLFVDRLRSVVATLPGTEVSTELEISIEYGPTRDWRSVDKTMVQALKLLLQEREGIGYSEVDAAVFMASPVGTTWAFSPEIVSLLALLHAGVSVRILDTSHPPEKPNQAPDPMSGLAPGHGSS